MNKTIIITLQYFELSILKKYNWNVLIFYDFIGTGFSINQ